MATTRRALMIATTGTLVAAIVWTGMPASAVVWSTFRNAGSPVNVLYSSPTPAPLLGADARTASAIVQVWDGDSWVNVTVSAGSTIKVGSSQNTSSYGATATLSFATAQPNAIAKCSRGYANTGMSAQPNTMVLTCRVKTQSKIFPRTASRYPAAVQNALEMMDAEPVTVDTVGAVDLVDYYRVALTDGQECVIAANAEVAASTCASKEIYDSLGLAMDATLNESTAVEVLVPADNSSAAARDDLQLVGADVYVR